VLTVINSTGSPPHRLSAQSDGRGHSISSRRQRPVNDGDGPRRFCIQETAAGPPLLAICGLVQQRRALPVSPQLDPLPSGPDVAAPGGEARDSFLLGDIVLELPSPSCYSVLPCLVGLRGSNYGATKVGTATLRLVELFGIITAPTSANAILPGRTMQLSNCQ
jgi:hypothetical protein